LLGAMPGSENTGFMLSPRSPWAQETKAAYLDRRASTPERRCQKSVKGSPHRQERLDSPIHLISIGNSASGVLTHFYDIDDAEQAADTPSGVLTHFYQIDDAEHQSSDAKLQALQSQKGIKHVPGFVDSVEGQESSFRRGVSVESSSSETACCSMPLQRGSASSSWTSFSWTSFDSESESSASEPPLLADLSQDALWGETFVSRIQAWYRKCRQTKKAASKVEEGKDLQADMEKFTSACMSEAFQDRVRTRAYFLYLNGCCDEKTNYYDAFATEVKLAYDAERQVHSS